MKTLHSPSHWFLVALVLAAFMLIVTEAHGQQSGEGTGSAPSVRKDIAPSRDHGVAKEQRGVVRKAKRAVKRTISRTRHGTSEIDSRAASPSQ